MGEGRDRPHIVAVPYPAQGHIPPIIHLARKLAAQGFIVTLVNVDSIHKNLSEKWSCPPGLDIRLQQVHCDLDMPAGLDAATHEDKQYLLAAIQRVRGPFEELVGRIKPTPCCIISDFFLSWAANITKQLSIPAVIYWPGAAAWCSLHYHLNLLISNGDVSEVDSTEGKEDKLICYLPGVDALRVQDLPDYLKNQPDKVRLDFLAASAERMNDSEWILVNSVFELEPHTFQVIKAALKNKNFVSVGPLFPLSPDDHTTVLGVSLRAEDSESLKWLDTQAAKSVLYISFGSISTLSKSSFEALAAGLEASKVPFLWVVRLDLVKSTTDERFKGFLERTKSQGLVVSWAPQIRALAHPSVGGFLSHCGWNSTFESICHGVPLLGWPCHSEQSMNCKLIEEDWKFGKRFSRKTEVSTSEVEVIIRDFMQGEDMVEICSFQGCGSKDSRGRGLLTHELAKLYAGHSGNESHIGIDKCLLSILAKP